MDKKKIEDYSEVFKALGHPTRLAILIGLCRKQCNVNHMVDTLEISQSTISQHLAILRRTRVVEREKRGLEVCYSVEDPKIRKIIEIVTDGEALCD